MKRGERAGVRTLDLLIKSQLLYRLSYALPSRWAAESGRNIERVFDKVNPEIDTKTDNETVFDARKGDWI